MKLRELLQGFKALITGGELPTPEESRQTPRLLCQYRANGRHQGHDFRVSVVDIGATGVGLECDRKIPCGEIFHISYPLCKEFVPTNAVEVEVAWCRRRPEDGKILLGARYTADQQALRDSWVGLLLDQLGLGQDTAYQQRKHTRLATAMKAELRDLETGRFLTRGKLANLSVGGALIESPDALRAGLKVLALIGPQLDYPTLSIHASLLHSRAEGDGENHLHSLQFINVSKEQMKSLETTLLKTLSGQA